MIYKKFTKRNIVPLLYFFLFSISISFFVSCSHQTTKKNITNSTSLNKPNIQKVSYQLGDSLVFFFIGQNNFKGITYFNLHDDENTAVQAGKHVVEKVGGKIIEIRASGKRNVSFSYKGKEYRFDPNRIYTPIGVKKTLKDQGYYSKIGDSIVTNFARFIVDSLLINSKIIVTLHNSSDGKYSIEYYKKGGIYEKDASEVYINPKNDPDDFFYVTNEIYFKALKEKGYNVLLQDNRNVNNDGSLSVYCGYNHIQYINVEAQKGHLQEQQEMLFSLQEILVK